jgi:hypothetical protein
MLRVDFYFHDGCLSQPSLLLLAKDVEAAYPAWTIAVHPLLENDVETLDLSVLPAVAINGHVAGTGLPNKEWLLKKLGEWARPDQ